MQDNLPRGLRNNNPLNIRRYDYNDWYGKIVDDACTDLQFEQFIHPMYGFRAAFILLHRYIKGGYKTIRDIIERWAPTADNNDVERYLAVIEKESKLFECDEIRTYSFKDMSTLVEGMFFVENGVRMSELKDRLYWYDAMAKGYDLYCEKFVH